MKENRKLPISITKTFQSEAKPDLMADTETIPKLAGVVILYYPPEQIIENILSYLPQLDLLIVMDNSSAVAQPIRKFFEGSEKIHYHGDGHNHGIAAPLNFAADAALKLGYSWLLTMDQDSRFEAGSLQSLATFAAKSQETTGIISAQHILIGKVEEKPLDGWKSVPYVMMSGNLLNLKAFTRAGLFSEMLYIDYVDIEYCLRLRKSGYQIVLVYKAKLLHQLGAIKVRRFLGKNFHPTHHSAERKYYITRNRLYVMKTNPEFGLTEIWPWIKELCKFVLFERNRLIKLRFVLRGFMDFCQGKFGPLSGKKNVSEIQKASSIEGIF